MFALLSEFGHVQEPDSVRALKRCREELQSDRQGEGDPMGILLWSVDWMIEERMILGEMSQATETRR
jgi:hypothetical protein